MTRREFLAAAAAGAGATLLPPIVGRVGPAFGAAPVDPATARRNRVVVVFLSGGNDGLNYVVPRGDVAGAPRLSVYRKARPTVAYDPSATLPLDLGGDADQLLGFNSQLAKLHEFYRAGRVAVVQGVDYPKHNYSHFASTDIWQSGEPERSPSSGWLGRHLDRAKIGEGELRAAAIGSKVPLLFQGRATRGVSIASIAATTFGDGASTVAPARHATLEALAAGRADDPLRAFAGRVGGDTVRLVNDLAKTPPPPSTGSPFGDAMLTARVLLEQNLGVECVYVEQPGYDTHANQRALQEPLLATLDTAMETFWLGTAKGVQVGNLGPLAPDVAARTLIVIVSEFGRRIGEANGVSVAGTDHGAAAPVVLVGPPASPDRSVALVPGLHGDHPSLGTVAAPAENLAMTTDLRSVYSAILQSWLADPDPLYDGRQALSGLFSARGSADADGRATPARTRVTTGGTTAASAVVEGRPRADAALAPSRVSNRPSLRINERHGGRGVHPVTATAAIAFDAIVALLVLRSGKLSELKEKWRLWRAGTG